MSLEDDIQAIIDRLNEAQGIALAKRISTTFTLGFQSTGARSISSLQKEQIKKVYKENLGRVAEMNDALGLQMERAIKERIALGGDHEAIRKDIIPMITEAFGDSGKITIDRTGQTRTVIEVGKDGTLRRVEKTITQPYTNNLKSYSEMLSSTASHQALEKGREAGYIKQGVKKWRPVGGDERSRPWHQAIVGNVYEYGTEDSDMAEEILQEPFCRHRQIPFFDDPKFDTPASVFEKRKEDAGLFWDKEKGQWSLPESKA